MFEEVKSELEKYDIQVIGLCNEDTDTITAHAKRDSLTHALLSDPKLNIIRQ